MKVHKIKNIEKNVCCCEQKIAYNFAFMWQDAGKRILNSDVSEVAKSHGLHDIENSVLRSIKDNPQIKKYNIDGIIVAFRNGFRTYCKNSFIANDYESIGNIFKIPYEVE